VSAEEEIRASLVADLSLSHVFYHDAEMAADDLLAQLKQEWTSPPEPECPYTHAHTRNWCGYDTCRES